MLLSRRQKKMYRQQLQSVMIWKKLPRRTPVVRKLDMRNTGNVRPVENFSQTKQEQRKSISRKKSKPLATAMERQPINGVLTTRNAQQKENVQHVVM